MTNKNPPSYFLFWSIAIGLLSIMSISWMFLEQRKLADSQDSIGKSQKVLDAVNNSLDAIAQQRKSIEQLEIKVANLKTQFQNRIGDCPSIHDLPIIEIPEIVVVSSKNIDQPKFRILVPEGLHQLQIALQGVVNRSSQPETIDWSESIQLPPSQWQQLEFLVATNSDEIESNDLAASDNPSRVSTIKGLLANIHQQRQLLRIELSSSEDPPQSVVQSYDGGGFFLPGELQSVQWIDPGLPEPTTAQLMDKTRLSFYHILEFAGNEWNLKLTIQIISQDW